MNPITENVFSFPARADTFPRPLTHKDKGDLQKRKVFGIEQAKTSNEIVAGLVELSRHKPHITESDWHEVYEWLIEWRYQTAIEQSGHQFGGNIPLQAELIRRRISDDAPNNEVIGQTGWMRDGAQWDSVNNKWIGGTPTRSSEITREFGELAHMRFSAEGIGDMDILQNCVTLPNATRVNGNKLLRGNAINKMRDERVRMRGDDARKFYPNDDIVIAVSGEPGDREMIFNAVMKTLAEQKPGEGSFDTWANCAYLLYQAPLTKRGWDAVIRNFISVAGTYMMGKSPKIPQDIDYSAFVVGQAAFVDYLREYNPQCTTISQKKT